MLFIFLTMIILYLYNIVTYGMISKPTFLVYKILSRYQSCRIDEKNFRIVMHKSRSARRLFFHEISKYKPSCINSNVEIIQFWLFFVCLMISVWVFILHDLKVKFTVLIVMFTYRHRSVVISDFTKQRVTVNNNT